VPLASQCYLARPRSNNHIKPTLFDPARPSGLLPNARLALSTTGLCLSINAYLYMLPLGLASSINTNIANALGGGDGARAKKVFLSGLALSTGLQTALVTGLLLG
jgi:hypothetical protein